VSSAAEAASASLASSRRSLSSLSSDSRVSRAPLRIRTDAAGRRRLGHDKFPVGDLGADRRGSPSASRPRALCAGGLRGAQQQDRGEREQKARTEAEPMAAEPHRSRMTIDQARGIGRAAYLELRQVLTSGGVDAGRARVGSDSASRICARRDTTLSLRSQARHSETQKTKRKNQTSISLLTTLVKSQLEPNNPSTTRLLRCFYAIERRFLNRVRWFDSGRGHFCVRVAAYTPAPRSPGVRRIRDHEGRPGARRGDGAAI
jgi:hypothetical protein